MNDHNRPSPVEMLVSASVSRPRRVLLGTAVVVTIAVVLLGRTNVDLSLQGMLGRDSAAAAALQRVLRNFRTADDLLVVASAPTDAPPPEARHRLLEYAGRLSHTLTESPGTVSLCTRVTYRENEEVRRFVTDVATPAGLYYLDDAALAELLRRLEPEAMHRQMVRNETLLAAPGPAADALAKAIVRDPLRLREFIDDRFFGASPRSESGGDAAWSDDGRSLLIRVGGVKPVDDVEFAQRFTDEVARVAHATNTDGLRVEVGGGYAIAAFTSRSIRSDAMSSVAREVILLHALFFLVYRRLVAPLLICITAAAGITVGFGVHTLLSPAITPLTAVIAAMLGGLGVDYGIHFLSHYQSRRAGGVGSADASVLAARHIGGWLLITCLTTLIGFVSICCARVAMLRDFAMMGALGLIGSLIAVFTLMPAALRAIDRRSLGTAPGPTLGRLADIVLARPRSAIAASLLIVVAFGAVIATSPGLLPRFESDPKVMHPSPSPPLEATDRIADMFAIVGESMLIEVRADSPDELVARAHDVGNALRTADRAAGAGVTGSLGLHTLLPDPRHIDARTSQLAALEPDRVIANFNGALEATGFDPDAFAGYSEFLRKLTACRAPPRLKDVADRPGVAEQLLPALSAADNTGPCTLVIARLSGRFLDSDRRDAAINATRAAIAPVPGATLTGITVVSSDLELAARRDLPRLVTIAFVLSIGWLLIAFRRPARVLLALVPIAFGTICMLGFMIITGQKFNIANIIALPLLAGIALDSGVFLVSAAGPRRGATREHVMNDLRASTQAIVASGATAVIGFGTLYWTSIPATASLGVTVVVGVTASVIGAVFLLVPLLGGLSLPQFGSAHAGETERGA